MADNFKVPSTLPSGDDGVVIGAKEVSIGGSTVKVGYSALRDPNNPANPADIATETTLSAVSTRVGSTTETAPATDTAASGLNGRLQRIAQRLSSLIALLPTALGANGGLKVEGVAGGVAQPVSGPLTDSELRASAVPVSAASLPLPSGAATAANQDTGNSSLASLDSKAPALGQALAAGSVPVVLPAAQVTTLTPPAAITGFATSAKQDTAQTTLSSIDGKLPAPVSSRVPVDGSGVTQPVSAAALPLPSGAATAANQATEISNLSSIDGKTPSLGQALAAASVPVVLPAAQIATLTPPAAITGFALETGGNLAAAATVLGATADAAVTSDTTGTIGAKLRGLVKWAFERMPASLGSKLSAASLPVVIASDQAAVAVSAASLPLPTGAATASNQSTANSSLSSIDAKLPALVSSRVPVDGSGVTQPVSDSAVQSRIGATTDAEASGDGSAIAVLKRIRTLLGGTLTVTGGGGGTEYTTDAVAPGSPVGTTTLGIRDDQVAAVTPAEGDWIPLRLNAKGQLWVAMADVNGDPISSFGGLTQVTANFTRPADATAYAIGDVVCNSTSSPTVLTFSGMATANGRGGILRTVVLYLGSNPTMRPVYDLFIYRVAPAIDNDNATFTPTDSEARECIGVVPLSVGVPGDTTGTSTNSIYTAQVELAYVCDASSTSLYGVLVARNAVTPTSADTYYFALVTERR